MIIKITFFVKFNNPLIGKIKKQVKGVFMKKFCTMCLLLFIIIGCSSTNENNALEQDPNFHIYLCFGQSNMEGCGSIENQDRKVDSRFQVLQSYTKQGRKIGQWYKANPPLSHEWGGLSPADYFGRTMVENLPVDIKVGVINVAVGGCDIRLFDKDKFQDYDSTIKAEWFRNRIKDYNGNPYEYLINLARNAQKEGVIKGILLHQGETNTGNTDWPLYVKKIYNDILSDLSLEADSIPLLAGELYSGPGNACSSMNPIINKLPETIPNSYVISSKDCTGMDNVHFDSEGFREFGKRYANQMLQILDYED